jgi:coenzyme F420-reducing hydrogenase beta subunit
MKEKARQHFNYIDKAFKESYEPYLGEIRNVYYGNAFDSHIREKAASGGAVTSLIKAYLDKHCESGAFLHNGTNYSVYKKGDILPQGSIYHARNNDIPMSYPDKLVVVCLPCQVSYFREIMPDAVIIGLFCSHRVDLKGVLAITRKYDVVYRYKYNGNTGLKFGDYFIPSKSYWGRYLNYVHIPQECLKCRDATAEKADISVGDAHKHEEFYKGKNVIITRTTEGEALLINAVESGILEAE